MTHALDPIYHNQARDACTRELGQSVEIEPLPFAWEKEQREFILVSIITLTNLFRKQIWSCFNLSAYRTQKSTIHNITLVTWENGRAEHANGIHGDAAAPTEQGKRKDRETDGKRGETCV